MRCSRPLRALAALHARLVATVRAELASNASPGKLALASSVGAFIGSTPLFGLHALIALAVATVLRLNRVLALASTQVSLPIFAPFLVFTERQVGGRFRTGAWPDTALPSIAHAEAIDWAGTLFVDTLIGSVIVGGSIAVVVGAATWFAAQRLRAR